MAPSALTCTKPSTSPSTAGVIRIAPGMAICSMRAARCVVCPTAVVVHVQVAADRPHHHLARVQPDADVEGHAMGALHLSSVLLHGLLHAQGGVAGAHRVVLMRQRRPKQGHNAIAHDLVDGAFVAGARPPSCVEHRVEELSRLLGVALGQQLHGALEVGEEHRDLLALAFQGAAGGEDFLREIGGRVGRAEHAPGRWRTVRRRGGGASVARPDQDVAPLIDRQALALDEFVLQIFQGRVIELELPLEGAVGQAPWRWSMAIAWSRISSKVIAHPPEADAACSRRCGNGRGRAGVLIPHMVSKGKRKSWERVTQRCTPLSQTRGGMCHVRLGRLPPQKTHTSMQEHTMSPAKRDAKKHAKARHRRRLQAQERLARDRRQAQHAAEALQQALDDLGLPENLVTEIEGRLRRQQKLLGKIVGVMFPPLFGCRTNSELCRVRGWDKNLPSRLLGALPKRSWLKRLRRLGLEVLVPLWRHAASKSEATRSRWQWTWVG